MSRLALLLLFLAACQTSVQSESQTDVSITPDPKPDPQPEGDPQPVPPTPKETAETRAAPSCAPWTEPVLSAHTKTDDHLPTGIASGAVRANRATLWTRSSHKGRVRALVSAGPECPVLKTAFIEPRKVDGRAVHMPIEGLAPGTLYRYQVEIEGVSPPSAPGWFWTAPAADVPVRLAFSADVSGYAASLRIFDALVAAKPQLYLSLGDWPYVDVSPPEPKLPPQFRRHYIEARKGKRLTNMSRSMPIHAIWDDHEITNDWDARFGKWNPKPLANGKKVWREFWPVHGAPEGDIYRHYTWGPGLEIFHLDTRSHRDSNAAPRKGKTMLGPAQRAWLFEALAASKARFKLVITSIPLDYGLTGKDQWTGFVEERDAMLAHIRDKKIKGVVFLTADQHWAASHHLPSGSKQWQTGPIGYIAFKTPKRPPFQTAFQRSAKNFGILDYQPGSPATLTFRSHLERAGIVFEETIQEGAGRIEIKAPGPAWRWTLKGAHRFTGGGTQTLPMAPPGDYALSWIPAKGAAPVDGGTETLTDGGSIVFERAP